MKTRFGDTSPLLNISKEHGWDYGLVLEIADFCIHHRPLSARVDDIIIRMPDGFYRPLYEDVREHVEHYKLQLAGVDAPF